MSWLSPAELDKLASAESIFPSPIPVQSVPLRSNCTCRGD